MRSGDIYIEGSRISRDNAVKVLYDRYAPVLLGLCCRYCANREDAEDVLHEGFIKIIRHLSSFEERKEGSLLAWMKKIMVNTALNQIRDRNRKAFMEEPAHIAGEQDEPADADLFGPIITELGKERLLQMITSLPAGYRAVFNLYVFEEFSHKEIAQALHFTESTSKSQLSKARALLRHKIEEALQSEKELTYGHTKASY
jgi:RNA polymerase sigma-70 factor (ECF subfamily)